MVMIMIVVIAIMSVVVIMLVPLLVGFGIEPGADVGPGVGRIEPFAAQDRANVEYRIVDA